MASNKTSLYDGAVHILNNTLDLQGTIGISTGARTVGTTTIPYDGGVTAPKVGMSVYGHDSISGSGEFVLAGTLASFTISSGTFAGGDAAGNLVLETGSLVSFLNNEHICFYPKFEIAAIQITKTGTLTNLVPSSNRFPGSVQANGVTNWNDTYSVAYYGATSGAAGVDYALGDIDGGITIEGRFKKVTISSADSAICYLKATPSIGNVIRP